MTILSSDGLYEDLPDYPTDEEILDNYRNFSTDADFPVLDAECWDDDPLTPAELSPILPVFFGGMP